MGTSLLPAPFPNGLMSLFDAQSRSWTRVLRSRKALNRCFPPAYHTLRAITYIVSLPLLARLFTTHAFQYMEVIVGEEAASLRGSAEESLDVIEQLYGLREEGRLRIFLSETRPIHTKLYLLYGEEHCRAIHGSANFTETGWRGRQVNHIIGYDTPQGAPLPESLRSCEMPTPIGARDPFFGQLEKDYVTQRDICKTEFFGSLDELMNRSSAKDVSAAVRLWVERDNASESLIVAETFEALTEELASVEAGGDGRFSDGSTAAVSSDSPSHSDESHLTLYLPQGSPRRSTVERLLKPFDAKTKSDHVQISSRALLDHRRHAVPLMRVDPMARGGSPPVWMGLNGKCVCRWASLDAESLDAEDDSTHVFQDAIAPVENFLDLAATGQTRDLASVRSAILETLLYVFTAPFLHLHWNHECERAPSIPQRGPRALFLFGDSQNGKSTVLQFALALLAGQPLSPIPGKQVSADGVAAASQTSTAFPLVFDDVPYNRFHKGASLETILKGYWLRDVAMGRSWPALVLASNRAEIPGWMRSRVKRITFDVRYSRDDFDTARQVRSLTGHPGSLFPLFAGRYLQRFASQPMGVERDECKLGRVVLRSIWSDAGCPVPDALKEKPHEDRYPAGRRTWKALLRGEGNVSLQVATGGILRAEFEHYKLASQYETLLPSDLMGRQSGVVVTIERGADFFDWVYARDAMPLRYRWMRMRLRNGQKQRD